MCVRLCVGERVVGTHTYFWKGEGGCVCACLEGLTQGGRVERRETKKDTDVCFVFSDVCVFVCVHRMKHV